MITYVQDKKPRHWEAFLLALAVGLAIYLPFVILNKGYFIYYGDFNVQQIPFYLLAHDAVRAGDVLWNWNTDLGANFIGSYSFYLLFSPFFWLTLPFPSAAVPYLMAPLLVLKHACAALTAYLFLARWARDTRFAVAGSLLYAFSGWMDFNIFFNHFHEVAVFFPLLLLGVELLVTEDRRGPLAVAVLVNACVNYWFFVGEAVFVVLYVIVRATDRGWGLTPRRFFRIALEAALGVGCAAVVLAPSALALVGNPRTGPDQLVSGWHVWLYRNEQRQPAILQSLLFPPDLPARPNFFPEHAARWASLSAWLPLVGITGTLAYFFRRRNDWLKKLLALCLVFALVPGLNSLFILLNDSYYARWFYMTILLMALATVRALEDPGEDAGAFRRAFRWTAVASAVFVAACGLTPNWEGGDPHISLVGYPDEFWRLAGMGAAFLGLAILLLLVFRRRPVLPRVLGWCAALAAAGGAAWCVDTMYQLSLEREPGALRLGMEGYPGVFWTYALIAAACLALTGALVFQFRSHPLFPRILAGCTALVAAGFSVYYINQGRYGTERARDFIEKAIGGRGQIELPEEPFARADVYDGTDNLLMFWGLPGIQAFHSTVPASIMEFYPAVGVTRDVASRPEAKYYALRPLLSVRWLIIPNGKKQDPMPGYTRYGEGMEHQIYENGYYLPMGFAYSHYITRDQMEEVETDLRSNLMLRAVVLEERAIRHNADILDNLSTDEILVLDEEAMAEDVAGRGLYTAVDFAVDRTGFSCRTSFADPQLLFFSVPYEAGWSATVDGRAVDIEKANLGFMAVRVPSGEREIRFDYMTPGLKPGLVCSGIAGILLVIYLVAGRRRVHYLEEEPVFRRLIFAGDKVKMSWDEYLRFNRREEKADRLQRAINEAALRKAPPETLPPEERTLPFQPEEPLEPEGDREPEDGAY